MSRVNEWLASAGLAHFAGPFQNVDEQTFLSLQMGDYAQYGVTGMDDRKKLFSLIQSLKREGVTPAGAGASEAAIQAAAQAAFAAPRAARPASDRAQGGGGGGGGREKSKIRVCVRKRPMIKREISRGDGDVVVTDNIQSLTVLETKIKVDLTKYVEQHEFFFDEVFAETSTNDKIYARTCRPLIDFVFEKGKATCFAYGQTGAGKTFTMMGNKEQPGLYLLAARDVFSKLREGQHKDLSVHLSFFEIYGGKLYDLLNQRKRLVAREDGNKNVNIVGLTDRHVRAVDELITCMEEGNAARSTAATGANVDSSRSHAVLQIHLRKGDKNHGKFAFIDLAGSERASDTMDNDRQTRIESAEINKSLLALKECIRALDLDQRHVPFRGSKLTGVLRDSFVGQCRTVMVANIAPNTSSCEHTMNTLRYANRVKELRKGALPPSLAEPSERIANTAAAANAQQASMLQQQAQAPPKSDRPAARAPRPAAAAGAAAVERAAAAAGAAPAVARISLEVPEEEENMGGGSDEGNEMDMEMPSAVPEEEDRLARTHEELVYSILDEEDDVIAAHRQQIEDNMELVQKEMLLLQTVEQPGGSVDEYVTKLDDLLKNKVKIVNQLRERLAQFQQRLREEETLSRSLHPRRK